MITEKTLNKLEFVKVLSFIAKYVYTENGKKIVSETRPMNSAEEIILEGELVSEAKEFLIELDVPPINYLPFLDEVLSRSRIKGAVLTAKQIRDIADLAGMSRALFQYLKNRGEDSKLPGIFENELFVDKVFEHHIRQIFDESGDIADNASAKLKSIRKEIRDKNENLRKSVNRILKKFSEEFLVQEEYVTQRDGRIVLPVKAEHKRHVRGFIHSESATGQTVYIEPEETLELNNEILTLTFAEKREIERILRKITEMIGEKSELLKISLNAVSRLDAIFAKARYSTEIIGSFPEIDNNKTFRIIKGRHPILLKKLGRENTVPLDLEIGDNNVVLITGPNAGGKTVVLKNTGLLTALVMSGIHIPADPDSNFHFISAVLLDIGDEQSIEEDLSTFSSHLTNIREILKSADNESLVLLDEIGTGTDPAEGAALGITTLQELKKSGARVLATTHHGSLKIMANELEGFENASMEFDSGELRPTYLFRQGVPGSSYAFEVAARIGLPDEFLKSARKYLDSDKFKVEKFLIELEEKSRKYQAELNTLEKENIRLKGLANLYQKKVEKLQSEEKEIIRKAKEEARQYVSDVNKRVEKAIREIRESAADKKVVREKRNEISEIVKKNVVVEEDKVIEKPSRGYYEKGDYVQIKETGTKGEIIDISSNKKDALLLVGSLRMKVKTINLIPSKKKDTDKISSPRNYNLSPHISGTRLDIRGWKPEEAEFEVIRFLDESWALSLQRVEILHGKGTGALKKSVHDILKKHENVSDYYFENIEFGGEGITIVEFR